MKVKELVSLLRCEQSVELREDNFFLCHTNTGSKVMNTYSDRKIKDWFCYLETMTSRVPILVINIESEV